MPTPVGSSHIAPVLDRRAPAAAADPVPLIRPDQFREVIKTGDVVVEFFNFGCPYCRAAGPELEKVATAKLGKVKFAKMSLGDPMAQMLAGQFGTTLLPGFAIFRGGQFVGSFGRQGRDPVTADFIKANVEYAFNSIR